MIDYEQMKIAKFNYWTLSLNQDQRYLGRTLLIANKKGDRSLADAEDHEILEMRDVFVRVENALRNLFQPDRFNYAQLGNEWQQLHIHIIPRYNSSIKFDDIEFLDKNQGKNYAPYEKFPVSENTMYKIRDAIKAELDKDSTKQ